MRYRVDWLVVGDRAGTVIPDAVIDVDGDGRIGWCGPASEAPAAADAPHTDGAETVLDGVVCPGFVNTHGHAPMVLFRGAGEGLPLDRWLREVMWPREARLTGEDVAAGMKLASAEMLRHGVTTSTEMYFHADQIIDAVRTTGARLLIAAPLLAPPGVRQDDQLDQQLTAALELAKRFPADPRVEICLGPHSAYAVPLPFVATVAEEARRHELLLHLHVAETEREGAELAAKHGASIPQLLADHGVLGGRVLAAHSVWLDDEDIEIWREYDVAAAHCPGSNAKLASGTARLMDLLAAGVRVGLGSDGPASNNNLDVLSEVRLASQLARLSTGDSTALSAAEALWLATGGGAAAIGRTDIGQLETGRWADFVQFRMDDSAFVPLLGRADVLTHLVWSARSRHIRGTWVGGQRVFEDGSCLTVDEAAVRADVQQRASRLNSVG